MKLVTIEFSQLVYLTHLHRPSGQLYLPEAASRLAERYSFVKTPAVEDLSNPVKSFGMGKFQDIQIAEFGVYNDGFIVSSASNTAILDAFMDDFLSWTENTLQIVPSVLNKIEKFYESRIVIKSELDLASVINPAPAVINAFNHTWNKSFNTEYEFATFNLDCNPTQFSGKRKPHHFGIERRAGFDFDENVFFSVSPLSTNDHVALLNKLETLGRKVS